MMGLNQVSQAYEVLKKAPYKKCHGCYLDSFKTKEKEIEKYEKEYETPIPEVLRRWSMANPDIKRTPAYFNGSLKVIENLLKVLSNPF